MSLLLSSRDFSKYIKNISFRFIAFQQNLLTPHIVPFQIGSVSTRVVSASDRLLNPFGYLVVPGLRYTYVEGIQSGIHLGCDTDVATCLEQKWLVSFTNDAVNYT